MGNRPTSEPGRFRAVPERSPEFAHLSLDRLRTYRRALSAEEGRVSYWRRIIQARLDLLRASDGAPVSSMDDLRGVFAEARVDSGRSALLTVMPRDDIPPLPDLVTLWATESRPDDPEHTARLLHDLTKAESQLSAYRTALHKRLAGATGELIARYREQPELCLSALPVQNTRLQRAASG
jgi:hypothetical protein